MKENLKRILLFVRKHKFGLFNLVFILFFLFGLIYIGKHSGSPFDVFIFDVICLFLYVGYVVFDKLGGH